MKAHKYTKRNPSSGKIQPHASRHPLHTSFIRCAVHAQKWTFFFQFHGAAVCIQACPYQIIPKFTVWNMLHARVNLRSPRTAVQNDKAGYLSMYYRQFLCSFFSSITTNNAREGSYGRLRDTEKKCYVYSVQCSAPRNGRKWNYLTRPSGNVIHIWRSPTKRMIRAL